MITNNSGGPEVGLRLLDMVLLKITLIQTNRCRISNKCSHLTWHLKGLIPTMVYLNSTCLNFNNLYPSFKDSPHLSQMDLNLPITTSKIIMVNFKAEEVTIIIIKECFHIKLLIRIKD